MGSIPINGSMMNTPPTRGVFRLTPGLGSVRMSPEEGTMLIAHAATHQGPREYQEDRYVCDAENGLFAAIDGIAGAGQGDVAAQIVAEEIRSLRGVPSEKLFLSALGRARKRMRHHIQHVYYGSGRMGCCLTAVWVLPVGAGFYAGALAHAGDTRARLFANGQLWETTTDRKMYSAELQRSFVTTWLGTGSYLSAIAFDVIVIPPNVWLILQTDGLYGRVNDGNLEQFLQRLPPGATPQQVAEDLVDLALRLRTNDNVTVVVART